MDPDTDDELQMNEIILGSLEPPESKQISRPRMDTVDSQELLMKKTGDVRIVENERREKRELESLRINMKHVERQL